MATTGTWEIALQGRGRYQEVLAAARWAEAQGLAAFALPDHYLASSDDPSLPAWDHLVQFAGLARDTSSLQLVDLVSPITFRHPAVYAKMASTLADMSGGRFVLGLGTGWFEDEHRRFGIGFPDQDERFERLEEALAYLDALKQCRSFQGQYYQLDEFAVGPAFAVPIVTGGTGSRRTPALAGRFCDELNLFPSQAGDVPSRVAACRSAAVAAGRDPGSVRISYTLVPMSGADDASYRRTLEQAAAERQRTPAELEGRLARRGIPYGPVEQVREQLAAMVEAGVSRFYLQSPSINPSELGAIVSPYLPPG
ncbi:MAG TPA: LLM class flavin-dependent oxidoreductase [Acidimicrobiia bacterium]